MGVQTGLEACSLAPGKLKGQEGPRRRACGCCSRRLQASEETRPEMAEAGLVSRTPEVGDAMGRVGTQGQLSAGTAAGKEGRPGRQGDRAGRGEMWTGSQQRDVGVFKENPPLAQACSRL